MAGRPLQVPVEPLPGALVVARLLALLRRRLGDEEGARSAFAESARAVRTIAAGVRDERLREGFLAQAAVREVLEAAARGD